MNWEALTAIGTLLSALIIAVTVLLTARQVRITARQLDHLRRATQLEGAMRIFSDLNDDELSEAIRFVGVDLAGALSDEKFRSEIRLHGTDAHLHKEMLVARRLEQIGAYVKYGLLDGDVIYDIMWPVIVTMWQKMAPVVAIYRAAEPAMWENFEYLYDGASRFAKGVKTSQDG